MRAQARPSVTHAIASAQYVTTLARSGSARSASTIDDEDEPGARRDEVEDADKVLERRVVGPLLVVVVEAVELRAHDPEGKRGDEEQVLVADVDALDRPARAEDELGQEERGE